MFKNWCFADVANKNYYDDNVGGTNLISKLRVYLMTNAASSFVELFINGDGRSS